VPGFLRRIWNNRGDLLFHELVAECLRDLPGPVLGQVFDMPGVAGCSGGTILRSGDDKKKRPQAANTAKVQSKDRDMGAALRSVYQKTIDETIPPEMLDLLSKLD
jgi:hypothetical protein